MTDPGDVRFYGRDVVDISTGGLGQTPPPSPHLNVHLKFAALEVPV